MASTPFLARRQGRRRRRADRRRSAARGRRGALPAGAAGGAELHPPRDADDRRQAPAGGARETLRASSIMSRSPASPARRSRLCRGRRRRSRGSSGHTASAGRRRLRREERRRTRRRSPPTPTASWSARRWSRRCEPRSSTARRGRGTVEAVTALVAELAEGVRGARADVAKAVALELAPRESDDELEFQRRPAEDPLIPASARRRKISGSNARRAASSSSTRTSRPISSSCRAPAITCACPVEVRLAALFDDGEFEDTADAGSRRPIR